MAALTHREWVPGPCEGYIQTIAKTTSAATPETVASRIDALITEKKFMNGNASI